MSSERDRMLVRIGYRWGESTKDSPGGTAGTITKDGDVDRVVRRLVDAELPHPFQGKNHLECDLCGKSEPNPKYHPRELSVRVMESALFEIADRILDNLGCIAPEDLAMRRTKVFDGLIAAIRTADRDRLYQVVRIPPQEPAAPPALDDLIRSVEALFIACDYTQVSSVRNHLSEALFDLRMARTAQREYGISLHIATVQEPPEEDDGA